MSITTALKARREALADREAGFTLIELLVVVLIIGILAAIAIPVYLGVQNNAKESAVRSDLANNKTALNALVTSTTAGTLPANNTTQANLATAAKPFGWAISNGATFGTYSLVGTGGNQLFCMTEQSANGTWFYVTTNQAPTAVANNTNSCPANGATTW